MLSFGLPTHQIKSLMNKFLKQSKIFPLQMAKDILMRIQIAEQEQAILKKKNLIVADELFNDEFQDTNRDQRSTLFYGLNKQKNTD